MSEQDPETDNHLKHSRDVMIVTKISLKFCSGNSRDYSRTRPKWPLKWVDAVLLSVIEKSDLWLGSELDKSLCMPWHQYRHYSLSPAPKSFVSNLFFRDFRLRLTAKIRHDLQLYSVYLRLAWWFNARYLQRRRVQPELGCQGRISGDCTGTTAGICIYIWSYSTGGTSLFTEN